MSSRDLFAYMETRRCLVDEALERLLPTAGDYPQRVHEAMRYSVFAGGKRLRPILTLAAAEATGGKGEQALVAAAAVEMIHTYSLIHDDLPAMDDDDLRRGKPTCHKVFGEAMAILAGDALLTQAFLILADGGATGLPADWRLRIIREIGEAAGSRGMVGGQVVDILSEDQEVDLPQLLYLHTHKTGALIRASLRAGGIAAGCPEGSLEAITRYGERIGLAFQIVDDILNVEGKTEELGKRAGSDLKKRKATYPALMGVEASRQQVGHLIREAKAALGPLGDAAWVLAAIADFVASRRH